MTVHKYTDKTIIYTQLYFIYKSQGFMILIRQTKSETFFSSPFSIHRSFCTERGNFFQKNKFTFTTCTFLFLSLSLLLFKFRPHYIYVNTQFFLFSINKVIMARVLLMTYQHCVASVGIWKTHYQFCKPGLLRVMK